MKRKLTAIIAVLALLIATVFPTFGPQNVWGATSYSSAQSACSSMNGTWSYRGTAGAVCEGVAAQYSGTCSSYGGSYDGSDCSWSSIDASSSNSTNSSDSLESARNACTDKGGTFSVTNGGSSGFTTTCTVNGVTTYTNVSNTSTNTNNSTNNTNSSNSSTGGGGGGGSYTIDTSAHAAILTNCATQENNLGNGAGVKCIILLVVNILSVLVGIVGIIGIVIVGIQYLTAGGNEEQTRKAKRRLLEIIIGMALYFAASGLLNWLLPNFSTSNSTSFLPELVATLVNFGA